MISCSTSRRTNEYGGLQRSERSNRSRATHLFDVEVGNANPANFPFLLKLCHCAPAFFQVFRRPMDLVKVDDIDIQPAQTVLAFAAYGVRVQVFMNATLFVPTQTALGEYVRPWSRPGS